MKRKMIAGLVSVVLGLAATACADSANAPVAPHDRPLAASTASLARTSGGKTKVYGMMWRKQLTGDLSASALIGPSGGVLTLPATGLRLVVPAGAVSRPTQFGVTALAGRLVAYDFEPAGSVFRVALRFEQDQSFIDTRHVDPTRVQAGYFPSRADLDQTRATGNVAELIPAAWSSRSVAFPIWHFSGYIVSWGFADAEAEPAY